MWIGLHIKYIKFLAILIAVLEDILFKVLLLKFATVC